VVIRNTPFVRFNVRQSPVNIKYLLGTIDCNSAEAWPKDASGDAGFGVKCTGNKEDPRVKDREETESKCKNMGDADCLESDILEEIEIEDFAVDGICGVY
jgi:mycofactocin precursor